MYATDFQANIPRLCHIYTNVYANMIILIFHYTDVKVGQNFSLCTLNHLTHICVFYNKPLTKTSTVSI